MGNHAGKLPEIEAQKLRNAMDGISPPHWSPRQQPGLLREWAFVMQLSAVEAFWNIHRRRPHIAPHAAEPEEWALEEAISLWRRKERRGALSAVRTL
jgi:hypothetical protein